MALTPCMSCLKQCGYLCGLLAALNIWFWIGMTIFNSMDNKWIKREILLFESYDADTSRYTTVFAICIALNVITAIGCCWCTTSKCYQDKDAVEYYTGGANKRISQDFDATRQINGSNGSPTQFQNRQNSNDKLIR